MTQCSGLQLGPIGGTAGPAEEGIHRSVVGREETCKPEQLLNGEPSLAPSLGDKNPFAAFRYDLLGRAGGRPSQVLNNLFLG